MRFKAYVSLFLCGKLIGIRNLEFWNFGNWKLERARWGVSVVQGLRNRYTEDRLD